MAEDCVPEAPNECCRTPGNVPLVKGHPDAGPDRTVRVCRTCGRRHIEFSVDMGPYGLEGLDLNMRGPAGILAARVLSVNEGIYTIVGADGNLMYLTLPGPR